MTPLVIEWLACFLFLAWGIGSVCSAWARQRRYRKYQRDSWLLTDAFERVLMAIAFCLGSLILAPHPAYDLEWLRPYSRLAWLIAFIPFAIGIFLDWRSLARIEEQRNRQL